MKHASSTAAWPADARIIEFGLRDGAAGEQLVAAGCRYLGVLETERQANRLAQQHPRLTGRLVVCRRPDRVRQNNADVLLLNGGAAARLRRFRDVRHARFVACPLRNGPLLLWTAAFWLGHFVLWRLAWPRTAWLGRQRWLVIRVRRPKQYSAARRFIPHRLGVEGFFRRLQAARARYVVLRWFETLPQVAAGEDLDLLVADQSLPAVRALLDSGPGLQAVDLYSVCGASGADYRKLPYYPPYLAEQLLARARADRGLYRVPCPQDHFLSLAYHAVYRKGLASGLAANRDSKPVTTNAEHDYTRILRQLAGRLGLDVAITLADLDDYLDSQSWRPPHDMLVRLARKNKWLRTLVRQAASGARRTARAA